MKSAVCLLVKYPTADVYLAVSRRNNPDHWGFPGGKVDPGETNLDALHREVSEEIGILLFKPDMEPIHSGPVIGDVNYWVTTYMLVNHKPFEMTGMEPEAGLVIAWKTEAEMCDIRLSPFSEYNRHVFEAMHTLEKLSATTA